MCFPRKIWIYTDASKTNHSNLCGIAYCVVDRKGIILCEYIEQIQNITVNQGELIAIYRALELVKDYEDKIYKAIIVSDSLYSVKVLNGKWRYRKNKYLIDEIIDLRNSINCKTSIVWIKGHSNNPFNDRADLLANIARS
jgi:ribonuclease HI